MKILIATINDCHSGEAYWDGWTVRISLNDDVFDAIVNANNAVYLASDFVMHLMDNLPEDAHDLTKGSDGQAELWVLTEPSSKELDETIWDDASYHQIYDAYRDDELRVSVPDLSMSLWSKPWEPAWCIANKITA